MQGTLVTTVSKESLSENSISKSQEYSNIMSTFQSLPLKIRHQIYTLLLYGNCVSKQRLVTATPRSTVTDSPSSTLHLAITGVSRQKFMTKQLQCSTERITSASCMGVGSSASGNCSIKLDQTIYAAYVKLLSVLCRVTNPR